MKKKIIFWAVDCQKDFINPDGALYIQGAETIKPTLKKLTEYAKEHNILVVNTQDSHIPLDEELSDEPDYQNTFPEHCMFDTKGYEFIEETNPEGNISTIRYINVSEPTIKLDTRNIIIHKNKFDVFEGSPHTDKILTLINPDTVVVYGVATNVCVNCAVLGLLKRGINVWVVSDAIKELPNISVEDIYDTWNVEGAVNVNFQILLQELLP